MPERIAVRCSDPVVRGTLEQWLIEGRLQPPRPLTLDVRVEPLLPGDQPDPRPIFRQPDLTIRSGGADGRVTIVWDRCPAEADLLPGSRVAAVRLSPEAVRCLDDCLRQFMITTLIFLLRRVGWHHVHGGIAVDPLGRGWLLAGNSGMGKSTTVALLAARGWSVGTDDIAFLAGGSDPVAAYSFHSPIALRPGGEALLRRGSGRPLPDRGKVGYWPEDLGSRWCPRIEPQILIFPSVGEGRTEVSAVRPAQAVAELVRWSAWVTLEPTLAQDHLDLLTRLAAQARAYRIRLGPDLFQDPDLAARLIP
ncbi:MAG TPA: hypothetical protein VMG41_17145 [Gemmatimonadales bacterium]|nr:hypothetical protein [Gemmatimonadales bacterium]